MTDLRAPFPWFGGKRLVAPVVWEHLGAVDNYVEPFFGSGAMLLGAPVHRYETVNDIDGYVANFWRALKHAPDEVAEHADNPVNECDLHARHVWLLGRRDGLAERLMGDPIYYDAQIAGWWVWGLCCWIGSGWCSGAGPWTSVDGVFCRANAGQGVNRQLPHLGNAGLGVNRKQSDLVEYMHGLAERLRRVRVCCGDWKRVCGPSVTTKLGTTAVFLDPPYSYDVRAGDLYLTDSGDVAADVRAWAIEHGADPRMRIALCGYHGEHAMPDGWDCHEWASRGAYIGKSTEAGERRKSERIWFSPHCLGAGDQAQQTMF